MPKPTPTKSKSTDRDLKIIHDFALTLERGRFTEYAEILTNSRRLLWKSFVAGLGRGFGAVVGATIVVALVVGLLAWLGGVLPDPFDDFFTGTSKQIQGD